VRVAINGCVLSLSCRRQSISPAYCSMSSLPALSKIVLYRTFSNCRIAHYNTSSIDSLLANMCHLWIRAMQKSKSCMPLSASTHISLPPTMCCGWIWPCDWWRSYYKSADCCKVPASEVLIRGWVISGLHVLMQQRRRSSLCWIKQLCSIPRLKKLAASCFNMFLPRTSTCPYHSWIKYFCDDTLWITWYALGCRRLSVAVLTYFKPLISISFYFAVNLPLMRLYHFTGLYLSGIKIHITPLQSI